MDLWPMIRSRAKCCSCGGSLKDSHYMNMVSLNKVAEWQHPSWGNILVSGSGGRASAIVCDGCVDEARRSREWNIKYAIEWNDEHTVFKYHPVEKLKDTYPITEEMLPWEEK